MFRVIQRDIVYDPGGGILCTEIEVAVDGHTCAQNERAPLADVIGRLMVRRVVLGGSDMADGSVSGISSLRFVGDEYAEDTAADVVKKGRELQSEKIDQLLFRREDILHDLRSSFQSFADGLMVSVDSVVGWKPRFSIDILSL